MFCYKGGGTFVVGLPCDIRAECFVVALSCLKRGVTTNFLPLPKLFGRFGVSDRSLFAYVQACHFFSVNFFSMETRP